MTLEWEKIPEKVLCRPREECAELTPGTHLYIEFCKGKPQSWWFICRGDIDPENGRKAALWDALFEAERVVAKLRRELGVEQEAGENV